jgi:TRAP-type C4-dicarboxylate transport system permease small subunit
VGTAAVLAAAGWFVKTARHELENRVVSNELLDLDKHYMYRALPVLAGGVLALVLAVVQVARRIRKKRKEQQQRDNAPVRSIVD